MTTIINGSSPSITFSDNTTQTTAGLPLTGGTVSGAVTVTGAITATGGVIQGANAAPTFRATQTSTTSIPNTSFTKVLFDTVTFDTNSNFSSSRFTPTVAGYYQVTGIIRISLSAGNFVSPYIFKNGSSYQGVEGVLTQGTGDVSGVVNALVYCNGSTDYIEFYAYQNSGGSKNTVTGTTNTSFIGFLARSA